MTKTILDVQDEFINQWGIIGTSWGINRTMAQIHGLLLVSQEPLTTDQVMESLTISRGNAHTNIKNLLGWGLVKKVIKKGVRKELFQAEKDPWKMFCTIAKERKRREMEPLLTVLEDCTHELKAIKSKEAKVLHGQLKEMTQFVGTGVSVMDKISKAEQNVLMKLIMKLL